VEEAVFSYPIKNRRKILRGALGGESQNLRGISLRTVSEDASTEIKGNQTAFPETSVQERFKGSFPFKPSQQQSGRPPQKRNGNSRGQGMSHGRVHETRNPPASRD